MNKTKIGLIMVVMTMAIFGITHTSEVFAQESNGGAVGATTDEPYQYILAGLSFITSGIFYSSSGWIKKVRRKLAGQAVRMDYQKMGKSILIGVILGAGAMVYSAYNGDVITITSAEQFFAQVAVNTAVILLVDKWILGRAEEKGEGETMKAAPTADDDDDDWDSLEEEIPDTEPPGKEDVT